MSVDDSATGFQPDASNVETGWLARSSHGARSMGASNDGAGVIPDAGAAGASSAYRIALSARSGNAASSMPVFDSACGAAASNATTPASATGEWTAGAAGMNASSTIGALSSNAGAASCASGTRVSCVARPWVADAIPVGTAAAAGAAMPAAAAAIPATVAAAAAACPASADCALSSVAHCAVLASIERSVSCTLGAGVIGAAGFPSMHTAARAPVLAAPGDVVPHPTAGRPNRLLRRGVPAGAAAARRPAAA
ncbi:hypothetical protein L3V59_13560 [Burkholderia aenigmatica]|uniref:hypothetical protein n=1 Tax=Burkholderia aenigmatica TaxID=2015348 RepID=UPI001F21795E|nr:hypothetical protein L3V59_13560 [Burkholderia aenigmatica]